jgi:hypothetical protein
MADREADDADHSFVAVRDDDIGAVRWLTKRTRVYANGAG